MKSWDESWEKVHQTQEWGKYPPEELIRFIARFFYRHPFPDRNRIKILDLGCGTGACSWYLAREGFSTFGIDGSRTAVKGARERFKREGLSGEFILNDFIEICFANNSLDCVVDMCSIQHNQFKKAKKIATEVYRVLRTDGKLFSMLVSEGSWKEPYSGKGYVHFYKLPEVEKLFEQFRLLNIETSERTYNNRTNKITHWVVCCEKHRNRK